MQFEDIIKRAIKMIPTWETCKFLFPMGEVKFMSEQSTYTVDLLQNRLRLHKVTSIASDCLSRSLIYCLKK